MSLSKKILGLTAALAALGAMAVTANATHTWSTYHWARTANPMPLQVVDSVTSEWQDELEFTVGDWNQANALAMTIVAGSESRKDRKRCTIESGKIKVCNASYGNNGWLGLASINLDSSGHITQGTAKLNDTYASSWAIPGERDHVMCQEVGHLFGLGHTSEDGSSQNTCMDYSQSPTSTMTGGHDIPLLNDIYSHVDSYDSYNTGTTTTPCRGGPKKCGSNFDDRTLPPGATRVRNNDFAETWVAPGPNGGLTVIHIRLAPGEHIDHGH